jgi:hypothetical protein
VACDTLSARDQARALVVVAAADADTGIRALRTAAVVLAGRGDLDGLRARADADDETAGDRRSGGLKAPSDGTQPSDLRVTK